MKKRLSNKELLELRHILDTYTTYEMEESTEPFLRKQAKEQLDLIKSINIVLKNRRTLK